MQGGRRAHSIGKSLQSITTSLLVFWRHMTQGRLGDVITPFCMCLSSPTILTTRIHSSSWRRLCLPLEKNFALYKNLRKTWGKLKKKTTIVLVHLQIPYPLLKISHNPLAPPCLATELPESSYCTPGHNLCPDLWYSTFPLKILQPSISWTPVILGILF